MNLIRHNPWELMNGLSREIDRLFDTVPEPRAAEPVWVPAVDIREYSDRYVLAADLPGLDPEAIQITLEDGVLTIEGSRADDAADDEHAVRRSERASGAFRRRFRLPEAEASREPAAEYRNGVLSVTIPKQVRPTPQRIKVTAH